jgi:hypothetical protein
MEGAAARLRTPEELRAAKADVDALVACGLLLPAGLIVALSSKSTVKSYNYRVRFEADDVAESLWLREERYVGSSTVTVENDWAELDGCSAGS